MGKKNKNKGSFDGKNAYDYIKGKFDDQYRSHMSDRESRDVYERKRDNDFQRYLMTGEKSTGWNRTPHKDDKRFKGGFEDKLFEAGIPPSQWQYYAQKAGITNVNSKGDAKKLINVYNQDERYQGGGAGAPMREEFRPDPVEEPDYTNMPLSKHMQGVQDRLAQPIEPVIPGSMPIESRYSYFAEDDEGSADDFLQNYMGKKFGRGGLSLTSGLMSNGEMEWGAPKNYETTENYANYASSLYTQFKINGSRERQGGR